MNKEYNAQYGAFIERGEILSEDSAAYTVKSLDRDGIITPPIKAINDGYDVGDRVFFFLFNDGSGRIIDKMD
ncbi:MAG: hypothetical protein IJ124_14505 [Clostridia bacterium]|nr:hypothetical protein [Clostridia bacterium]